MIDICTITWNRARRIERFYDSFSMRNGNIPHRFIVVDNNSEDNTVDLLSGKNNMEVVALPEKVSVAKAFNSALDVFLEGTSDYAFICHSDIIYGETYDPEVDAFDALVSGFQENPTAGIISPLSDRTQLHLQKQGDLKNEVNKTFQALYVAMLVSREAIEKAGKFDPEYEFYFMDMDFSRKVKESNLDIFVHKGVFFSHITPQENDKIKPAFFTPDQDLKYALADEKHYNEKWGIRKQNAKEIKKDPELQIVIGKIITKEGVESGTFKFDGSYEKIGEEN